MRYNRASIDSAIRAAKKSATKHSARVYVFATYFGWTLAYEAPPFGQAHYVVYPNGAVAEDGAAF